MNKKLLTTSVFLATSIAMAFEPWIGFDTPTPYYVNTGLDNGTNTAGYWFVATDEGDGGKSKVVWPVATGNELNDDSLDPIIDFCKGVCGTADLDKGTLTYQPFLSVGFNVVGEGAEGYPVPGDASSWGGICITYRSDVAPSLELGLGSFDAQIGYALPAKNLNKSKNGESYKKCIPWSDFNQPSWYKGTEKISGTEAATQLVSINFKMQGSQGQYKFNICAIGPYGDGTGKGLPETCSVPLTHPAISVNAKWSKGNDGYDATITVKDGEKELTLGTDYEIESNVNDATGIVIKTITGKGDYAGSVVKSLVPYIDENGKPQVMYDATVLTNNKDEVTELSGGKYVATGKVNMAGIKFNGEAHLILADDAEMVIETGDEYGIYASNNLTIYGQTEQNGILKATGKYEGIRSNGNITISGGSVTASGEYGIFSQSDITISGGTVTATGDYGIYSWKGNITISGGSVTASGYYDGIYAYNGITLGWTNGTDFIKASSYSLGDNEKHVSIAEGRSLKDGKGNVYSGTLTKGQVSDLEGQKLEPFEGKSVSFVNNFGETSVVFAKIAIDGEGNVAAPAKHPIRTGYTFAGWFTAPKDGSEFDFTATVTVNTTAYAHWNENTTSVEYIDENGKKQILEPGDYTVLTNDIYVEDLPEGWYVVEGEVKYTNQVKFSGDAHLILADDATIEIETGDEHGIYASNNLTIYGQSNQNGILKATGNLSGIYGNNGVTIIGGTVEATGSSNGIESYNNITISGGSVTATGENGSGIYGNNGVTISGGTVTATGKNGSGIYGNNGVTISGGSVTATGSNGDGIYGNNNGVTINGGTVMASGNSSGINTNAGHITLGWTNSTDFIKVSSIHLGADSCTVSIAEGKSFKDEDSNVYSGGPLSYDVLESIKNKTLVPSFNGTYLSDVNIAVADIPVQKYADGKPVCPSVVVTDGKDTLTAGTDYTVVCSNNNAVTSATLDEAAVAQIIGKGNYAGAIQKRFFIWNNICDYAAVQVFQDAGGKTHAEIDGAYDGTDAVAIDEDVAVDTVVFSREFTVNLENGGFSTIMLPFDVSASNLTGVKSIFEFAGVFKNNGMNAVGVNYVWCNAEQGKIEKDNDHPDCNDLSVELKAYTPYMVEMESATLGINGNVTLKSSNNATNSVVSKSNWVFRGALEKKEWSKEDEDIKNGKIWAFASFSSNGASIGKFVQLDGQNSVNPFQAYLYNLNGKQQASPNELGSMDIVILADYIDYTAVQIFRVANGNKHAVIDGSYGANADESEAVYIPANIEVNNVEMTREFPIGKYSTTVLPFGVNTENVEGLDAVLRYNGIKTVNGESSVRMKVVWATDKWVKRNDLRDKNNNLIQYDHADLTANTPYLVQMNDATLKLKSEAFPLMLEKTAPADVSIDGWTFRGTWQYKKWGPSCSTEGQNCDRETGNAYGFAASSSNDDKINVGDFVRVGEGAWILPMRAYLVSTDILEGTSPAQGVRANGNYVKRPSFAQEELPEFMSIVIDVDDEGKETTVIGQFNTRTGEIKMNYDRGKFDLKGRRVNGTNNAHGAYYGKKVLKKY